MKKLSYIFSLIIFLTCPIVFGGEATLHQYRVYFDSDNDSFTGCVFTLSDGGVASGVEVILHIGVSTGQVQEVRELAYELCSQPGVLIPISSFENTPWPVGVDNGVNGADVIEAYVPVNLFGTTSEVQVYVEALSPLGNFDTIGTNSMNGPIIFMLPIPTPTLGFWMLTVMIASFLILGVYRIRKMRLATKSAVLIFAGSLFLGFGSIPFISDGEVDEWGDLQLIETDPQGDSNDEDAIDLVALFLWNDTRRFFVRLDVVDMGNQAPECVTPEPFSTEEDTPIILTLGGFDINSDDLNFSVVTDPGMGTLGAVNQIDSNTFEVVYTPDPDVNGVDSFVFRLDDGLLFSSDCTVQIDVASVNDPPVAENDTYHALGHTTMEVPASAGVLINDSDDDMLSLVTVTDAPTLNGGLITLNSDGSFMYTSPDPGASSPPTTGGSDSFTYTVEDSFGVMRTATITFTFERVVWFVDNSFAGTEDGSLAAPFNTLLEAQSEATEDEIIFIFNGDGSDNGLQEGITLLEGMQLLGEPAGLHIDVDEDGPLDPVVIVDGEGATKPQITNLSGHVITLVDNNLVEGLAVHNAAGDGIVKNTPFLPPPRGGAPHLQINNVDIFPSGVDIWGMVISQSSGTLGLNNLNIQGDMSIDSAGIFFENNTFTETEMSDVSIADLYYGVIVSNDRSDLTLNAEILRAATGVHIENDTASGGSLSVENGFYQAEFESFLAEIFGGDYRLAVTGGEFDSFGAGLVAVSDGGQLTVTGFGGFNVTSAFGEAALVLGFGAEPVIFDANPATPGFESVIGQPIVIGSQSEPISGPGLTLVHVHGDLNVQRLDVYTNGGHGLLVDNSLEQIDDFYFAVGGGVIDAIGPGLVIDPVTIDLTFDAITSVDCVSGIDIDEVDGSFTVNGPVVVTNPSENGLRVDDSSGTFTFNGPITIDTPGDDGIDIEDSDANFIFLDTVSIIDSFDDGLDIEDATGMIQFNDLVDVDAPAGFALELVGEIGDITFSELDVDLPVTGGVQVFEALISGSAHFLSLNVNGGSVGLTMESSSGLIDVDGGLFENITGPHIEGLAGSADLNFNGLASQGNAGLPLVFVDGGHAGVFNFESESNLSATAGLGLLFNEAAGQYNFQGPVNLNTGASTSIDVGALSTGTLSFSDDLTVQTNGAVGISIASGSISVNNSDASTTFINTVSQTALSLTGAQIGVGGVSFDQILQSGPFQGVRLLDVSGGEFEMIDGILDGSLIGLLADTVSAPITIGSPAITGALTFGVQLIDISAPVSISATIDAASAALNVSHSAMDGALSITSGSYSGTAEALSIDVTGGAYQLAITGGVFSGSRAIDASNSALGGLAVTSLDGFNVLGDGVSLGGVFFNGDASNPILFDADPATLSFDLLSSVSATIGVSTNRIIGDGLHFTNSVGSLQFQTLNIANDGGAGLRIDNSALINPDFTFNAVGGTIDTINGSTEIILP